MTAIMPANSMQTSNNSSFAVSNKLVNISNLKMPAVMEEHSRSRLQSKPANKILHYGSRHVIQNTGWTTRLTKELPHLKPISQAKQPVSKHESVTAAVDTSKLSATSMDKPGVVKLNNVQADITSGNNNVMIQLIGPNVSSTFVNVSQPLPRFTSPQTSIRLSSGGLLTVPLPLFAGPRKPYRPDTYVGLPSSSNNSSTCGLRPSAVCFVPLSRSGPASISSGGVINVLSMTGQQSRANTAAQSAIRKPTGNIKVLPTPNYDFTSGNVAVQSSAVNVKSSAFGVSNGSSNMSSSKTVRTLAVFPASDSNGCPDIRVLNTQVRIHKGLVTEVNELTAESETPSGPVVSTVSNILSAVASSTSQSTSGAHHLPVYLIDCNGAKFGYYETLDGKRIRIAHDTSGQRYSPFWLIPPRVGPFVDSDVIVDVTSDTVKKTVELPTEAQVSAVTTSFTYEPLLVSEQTLVPVSGSSVIPKPAVAPVANNDDHYFVFRCYMCKFWSEDKTKLASHWLNFHMPDLQYCCPYCDRKFFTNVRAQMHVLHHHSDQQTPKITFRRSAHFAHTLSFELIPDISLDERLGEWTNITLEHADPGSTKVTDNTYSCRRCNYATRSASELRQHQKAIHLQFKPLICPHCPFVPSDRSLSFASECDLKLHVHANHPEENHSVKGLPLSSVVGTKCNAAVVLQAEICWEETWENISVSGEQMLQCRRCAFRAKKESQMWPHVLQEHKWPICAVCPSCVATITLNDNERSAGIAACASCDTCVVLGPTYSTGPSGVGQVIYVCNICSYQTLNHGNMMHHIRYNHTKCRPYACSYCNYVAVAYTTVKLHIESAHPREPVVVKDRVEVSDKFNTVLSTLFKKLVSLKLVGSRSSQDALNVCYTDKNSSTENSARSEFSQLPVGPNQCDASHSQSIPSNSQIGITGEHFKCKVCGYCCTDRSCMSRHIKYMHITARPHSCPYCSYNNVEKTKVRIHVKTHHPGQQKSVRTDRKLLEEMSWCAKKFYVTVNQKGQEVPQRTLKMRNTFLGNCGTNAFGLVKHVVMPNERFGDMETQNNASKFITESEEMFSLDDVEFEIKPDWYWYKEKDRNAELVVMHPTVALDHNYFQKVCQRLPADDEAQAASEISVKEEPIDIGYEDNSFTVDDADVKPNISTLTDAPGSDNTSALSQSWSDSDDDFLSSEMSDDSISLQSDHDDDNEFLPSDSPECVKVKEEADLKEVLLNAQTFCEEELVKEQAELVKEQAVLIREPPLKRRKTRYGNLDHSNSGMNWNNLKIDKQITSDAKICMNAVVELEDVMQIILAWQSGALSMEEGDLVV